MQVADIFHLLANLCGSLYEVMRNKCRDLPISLLKNSPPQFTIPPDISVEVSVRVPGKGKGEMNDYIKERFEEVNEKLKDGVAIK